MLWEVVTWLDSSYNVWLRGAANIETSEIISHSTSVEVTSQNNEDTSSSEWDREIYYMQLFTAIGICIHKSWRNLFNLLLFSIKVHGVRNIKFGSHNCKFFSNEHITSKEEICMYIHLTGCLPVQFPVWIKSINSIPICCEMRTMNGRDNEVIMCVYQGLSGSSYNTRHMRVSHYYCYCPRAACSC